MEEEEEKKKEQKEKEEGKFLCFPNLLFSIFYNGQILQALLFLPSCDAELQEVEAYYNTKGLVTCQSWCQSQCWATTPSLSWATVLQEQCQVNMSNA